MTQRGTTRLHGTGLGNVDTPPSLPMTGFWKLLTQGTLSTVIVLYKRGGTLPPLQQQVSKNTDF